MHKLKAFASLIVILVLSPFLLAMGGGDTDGPTRIPDPEANYKVMLTDQTGSRVTLTKFAIEGVAFVLGDMGKGQAAVPLDKVREVIINHVNGKLKAKITLAQGGPVELRVKPGLMATGKTEYGNYRIPLKEVRMIKVLGLNQ
jgi:hypothetical protein